MPKSCQITLNAPIRLGGNDLVSKGINGSIHLPGLRGGHTVQLRAVGFTSGPELVGTIVVLSDDGVTTRVEQYGNFCQGAAEELVEKAHGAGFDLEELQPQPQPIFR